MKKALLLFAALLVAGCGEKLSDSVTLPLSDADVERLLKEAVELDSLQYRDGLIYHDNKPYSGWAKMIHDSGQVQALSQFKDGKPDGLLTNWHDNGQKAREVTYKDGMPDGPYTKWHENGQKEWEATFKDGEKVSGKYWNSKGEEVESLDAGSVNPNLKYKWKGRSGGELIITGAGSAGLDRMAREKLQKASGAFIIPPLIEGKWVTSIGFGAFFGCSNLTSITIPDSVTSIEGYTFQLCSSLTSITIPDGVTSIGKGAFAHCHTLTSITIPDGVTSIEKSTFVDCTSLTSVTIPDSVTSIERNAFHSCTSLTSITIPDSVTSIGNDAFRDCTSLTSITIPDSVTSIEARAFYDCKRLTSITIPDSVTSIGHSAFEGTSLTAVTFLGDAPKDGGRVFDEAAPTIYRNPKAKGWGETFDGRPVKLISEKPVPPLKGSESASESPTAPNADVKPSADSPEPLISDADVERFAKDALEAASPPADYTGWTKVYFGGELGELVQWKNGKPDGPYMVWHLNGKIREMGINDRDKEGESVVELRSWYESGEKESEVTTANDGSRKVREWHKNGQKKAEGTMKDFDQGSAKYWNSKGEEVETEEEARN